MAEERTRKVHVVLFKETGKWGYEFDAYVRPSLHLWHEAELFADIEATQTEMVEGAIYSGFFVVLSGGDDGHFLKKLFTPEKMRALRAELEEAEALDRAGGV